MSESRDAIRELVFRYARCIDGGDLDGLGELFAHATLNADRMEPIEGAEAVRSFYEGANRRYAEGTPRTHHLTTNLIIEVDEQAGSAEARSYYAVFQQTPELPLQPIITGRYRDRFERAGDQWRFTERYIHVDLVGDLSKHLTFEI